MTEVIDRAKLFGERPEAAERIAPGYFGPSVEAEHVARYRWASRWVKNSVVLDVACGTGYGAPLLRAAGAQQVHSVDVSADALRFGRGRYELRAIKSDAHELPVGRAVCDTVVSLETLEHLTDPRRFLGEIHRVLRPKGTLLLSTPNRARTSGSNPYHVNEMTLVEIRRLLSIAGFSVAGVWGQHWRLTVGPWQGIRGLRRLLWEIERMPWVTRWAPTGFTPLYWCVCAIKVNPSHPSS